MEQSPSGSKGNNWNQRISTNFNCRLLIKSPSEQDQTIEEKQTRVSKYETLQVNYFTEIYPVNYIEFAHTDLILN